MTFRLQSSAKDPISTQFKLLKIPIFKQQKNNTNTKKLFTRKPLNTSQNSSRILSSRLKTQEQDLNHLENSQSFKNPTQTLLSRSKNIKFVSSKSSKSLQKLFINSCTHHLSTSNLPRLKKQISDQNKIYKLISKKNKLQDSTNFQQGFKPQLSQLHIIYDQKKNNEDSKGIIGSTELSSNENIRISDCTEDDFKNHQLQRFKRNQSFSFYNPKDKINLHKQCPNCLINSQKINQLENQNRKLENALSNKQLEIIKLNQKIQIFMRTMKENETFKSNLEYEIKILKEKQGFMTSQKDEIDNALKKLQVNFTKLTQEMKYKELELNIHKIYKTKSDEMQIKVSSLKKELNRAKNNLSKLMTQSKSAQNLWDKRLKLDLTSFRDYKRLNSQKKLKQPKIAKVYSQDSVFSLSSQECD